jgi:ketosteroid isomerase-like protein
MQNTQNLHPNAFTLQKIYRDFCEGNFDRMLAQLPDAVTFQVSGQSPLAGKFTKTNFTESFGRLAQTLTKNTYQFVVHDILASDLHGTVLGTVKLTVNGKPIELRTVHVWRIDQGAPIAGYEYTRDLYQFDAAFSAKL